jgi:hypothetical protein
MKVVKANPKHKDLGESLDGRMKKAKPEEKTARSKTQVNANLDEMARRSYGYGRWDAPHWFIGPEQGMGQHENNIDESLERRAAAWVKLRRLDLNDCRKFHCEIGEENWHCTEPVKLQKTWRPLLLLLMAYRGESTSKESLRDYQRDRWGMLDGETCVIELSGLAAPNAEEATNTGPFLPERIKVIRERIREHRPRLVVMYGLEQRPSYEQIAEAKFPREPAPFFCKGPTLIALAPHPVSRIRVGDKYVGNDYWIELGKKLRNLPCHSR